MPILVPGLVNLTNQLNKRFPARVKPDGWIGDAAHRLHTSGHNPDDTPGSKAAWDDDIDNVAEVRAIDVDDQINDPEVDAQRLLDWLRALDNVETVIRYFIYNGKIYHYRVGFAPATFAGDPHTEHIHIEGQWSQAADNNATFDFRLDYLAMPAVDDIVNGLTEAMKSGGPYAREMRRMPWQYPMADGRSMLRTVEDNSRDIADVRKRMTNIELLLNDIQRRLTTPSG